jgi:hypothetical protein
MGRPAQLVLVSGRPYLSSSGAAKVVIALTFAVLAAQSQELPWPFACTL